MSSSQEEGRPPLDNATRSGEDLLFVVYDASPVQVPPAVKTLSSLSSVTPPPDHIEEEIQDYQRGTPSNAGSHMQETLVNIRRKRLREEEYEDILKGKNGEIQQMKGTMKKLRQELRQKDREQSQENQAIQQDNQALRQENQALQQKIRGVEIENEILRSRNDRPGFNDVSYARRSRRTMPGEVEDYEQGGRQLEASDEPKAELRKEFHSHFN